jgi:hypothetical protein
VSTYYTRLKSLWDELNNFRSIPDCSCGALKILLDNKQHEYVMQFLMGLNDSFSHVRAQILMTEPLPSITKAFPLVVQEERQRNINIPSLSSTADSVALFTRGEKHQETTMEEILMEEKVSSTGKKGLSVAIVALLVTQWRSATSYMATLQVTSSKERLILPIKLL